MNSQNPLEKSPADYDELIQKIRSPESPVGIDAMYTHAIIIEYLRQIDARLERLEAAFNKSEAGPV